MASTPRVPRPFSAPGVLLALATLAACSDGTGRVAGPTTTDSLFRSYVAIGNSITSGFQSGGISDWTQRQSYAALLAQAMHTRFVYPSLKDPGCPPPIQNFVTGARPGAATAETCYLRDPATAGQVLNSVAVPGATSLDPISVSTPESSRLTELFLDGKTQDQRAAEAQPTFISVWIGNNDVLGSVLTGILTPTPFETFRANYTTMISELTAIPSLRGGVLIGVGKDVVAPVLFAATDLFVADFKNKFDALAGQTTTILPSCTATTTSRISLTVAQAIRAGTHPPQIGCEKNSLPGTSVGDAYVIDADEQTTLNELVTQYNAFIASEAARLGWAYYDPNPILETLLTSGCVRQVPDLGSPTQPFGACVSLDGTHPTLQGHMAVANALIATINAKYGTHLPTVERLETTVIP